MSLLDHRRGDAELTLLDSTGAPLSNADVLVEQRRHAFAFGNIGFDFVPVEAGAQLADSWLELFNTATLPFYWGPFEPERGTPDTERLRATAQWFSERGVTIKGHPLVWHTLAPEWLRELDAASIERLLRERIRREVGDFASLIDQWDAINEVVIMPVFDKDDNAITRLARERGRLAMIRLAFEEARTVNPASMLILNDFDLSNAYECLIEGVLEAGISIDAIGLQTHMHQGYWGEEKMLAMIDRFARYGLPLHLTESTLLSGHLMPPEIVDLNDYQIPTWPSTDEGEVRQADEIVRHYRSLLSHPSVEAVNYWGITDASSWLGAPVGLLRADGSRKPSFDALHSLIKGEWWLPPTPMRTDAEGRLRVTGFAGDYEVSNRGRSETFTIATQSTTVESLTLRAA